MSGWIAIDCVWFEYSCSSENGVINYESLNQDSV